MQGTTNQLRAKSKRVLVPAGIAAASLFAVSLAWNHHGVHAAGNYAAPLDDQSVSALTSLDTAMETVASHVTPAVVNVAVTSRSTETQADDDQQGPQSQQIPPEFRRFFGGQLPQGQAGPQVEHGIGSGVIISPDGYIVTNNHVVNGATEIRVTLHDRRILTAKVIGTDKLTDLAVIKVNASNLPSIGWGDSTELKPGQTGACLWQPLRLFPVLGYPRHHQRARSPEPRSR